MIPRLLYMSQKLDSIQVSGPGPMYLIGGDLNAGFCGELPSSDLIDTAALSSLLGFNSGSILNAAPGWLKFSYEGTPLFIAKKPLRYNLSWISINTAGLVYGSRIITIAGNNYRVRLMLGGNTDPASGNGREWDKLIYPITSERGGQWANYSSSDLIFGSGSGRYTWCQEKIAGNTGNALCRGGASLTSFGSGNPASSSNSNYGWRPVLELVS